jgi:hypothetical protein
MDRRESFFLLDLGGGFQVGFAEVGFFIFRLFFGNRREPFGREPGGLVFCALNFVSVPVFEDFFLGGRPADGFGARLGGVAVRALLLVLTVAKAATWAEPHPTAAAP